MIPLKLTVEFVPKPLWGSNPRNAMGDAAWDRVRKKVYSDAGYHCEICDASDVILQAHEVWDYDDVDFVQRLVRLLALCKPCHGVKHFARSRIHCTEDELDALIRHFMAVNVCDAKALQDHYRSEMGKWKERSAHKEWTVDWGEHSGLIRKS